MQYYVQFKWSLVAQHIASVAAPAWCMTRRPGSVPSLDRLCCDPSPQVGSYALCVGRDRIGRQAEEEEDNVIVMRVIN